MKPGLLIFQIAAWVMAMMARNEILHAAPGIPEPGITFYGTCADRQTGLAVIPTVVNWAVSDGTTTFTQTVATTPPTQIVSSDGSVYYAVEVAFQTRTVGGTTFQPPTPPSYALPMQPVSPTYTFRPSVNARPTTIQAINGVPVGEPLPASYTINDYSQASRGRVVRLDLVVGQPLLTYTQWATQHFGNSSLPEAQPGADPDGDGATNQEEYDAGTLPTDASSLFALHAAARNPDGSFTIAWAAVPGKTYQVQHSDTLFGSWHEDLPNSQITAGVAQTSLSFTDAVASAQSKRFYRIRVVP